eukprot:CAMPEP_0175053364 /NCGR_PEP_ID=MMETSP0052_2-20121109/8881_1 /TAXON_ID=51329 ORGANISM="Polytomella parva, Strain SAG 63-3" /NCGR_SAMPLE_ID=MMETSP0052_2 /ASSEMBLY_ACC=CAM_ASM_000194 /LENGTH=210 /DNA_ID=CAMNT_0016317885 /DNA_START=184 /DNA_END=816 /DNA_ORIENTATION=+
MACTFNGGVVIGSDGRVSTGTYISNRSSNKIAPLSDNVYLLRSGSAADTQAVSDYVSHMVEQLKAERGENPNVEVVANLVRQLNYQNKDLLLGAMIVAGYDARRGGQIYGCPIGGTISREDWTVDGSGSTYIWGFCDEVFKPDFTRAEAEQFVLEALGLAMSTDASSGGCVRMYTLTESGSEYRYVAGDQVPLYQGSSTNDLGEPLPVFG